MWTLFGVEIDPSSILTTVKVAGLTTLILLLLAMPIAWRITQMRSRWKVLLEAIVALPLVLPPTVLGFYLLIVMNPHGYLADFLALLGYHKQLTFSFTGLVIGSVIYSLPFAVQPLMHAFEQVPHALLEAAKTLRASGLAIFWQVVVPLSQRGFLTAATLTFAHTVGEFGVVLMLGGNIPGETRVVSIDIFNHVENMEYAQAHILSLMMLIFAFVVLLVVYGLNRRFSVKVA
jgi:molybdate transport system permease protein